MCAQAFDRVGVAFDLELKGLEAFGSLLGAVVLLFRAVGLDRDLVLGRAVRDCQRSGDGADLIVLRLRPVIKSIGEGVGTAACYGLASRDVVGRAFIFCEAVAAHGDICLLILCQRCSVVFLLGTGGCQGDGALADGQLSVPGLHDELGCHVISVRVLYNGRAGHCVRIVTRICSGCRCLQAADCVGASVYFKLQRLEALHGFLRAVVFLSGAVGLYRDLVLDLAVCDLQCAVLSADLVVFSLGARVQCVGECVLTLADYGPGARDVVDCALAIREAVAAHGNIFLGILCQRFAVIFLLPVRGGQGDGALGDLQLSGLVRDRELRCHVIAVFVLHDRGPRHVHRIVSRVCFGCRCGQAAHSILAAFDLELQRLEAAHGLLFAIVLELAAVGLDLDLVLGVAGLDRQGSVACRDGVVVRLRSVVQCVGECVLAGPDQGLAARDAVGCALALRESVAAHGDIRLLVLCQRLSVVFLLGCR